MKKFEEKKFNIGELKGISKESVAEHLKLYSGYVKNANLILEKIEELRSDQEKNSYAISEMMRRFGFEYNGIRNHEVYFESISDGINTLSDDSHIKKQIEKDFTSFDKWLSEFKSLALTRGIGWAILYFDRKDNRLLNAWVDEQHIGQLQDCTPIIALDMWEHSFVYDYMPSGKKNYVEDFFSNLNWVKVEENLKNIAK
jgi:Fe-Mn family superoxide dismutase